MIHVVLANKHYLGLAGGAERNISDIANWLVCNGFKVSIVSETAHGTIPAFPLHVDVNVVVPELGAPTSKQPDLVETRFSTRPDALRWAKRSLAMRKRWGQCVRKLDPDVVLTFLPHTSTMLLQELGDSYPILVTNQNDPAIDYFSDKHGSDEVDKKLRLESLALAAKVHFLIPTFADKMPPSVRQRSIIIPNVVPQAGSRYQRGDAIRRKVIAVGRLVPQKGFETLIDAFAMLKGLRDGWQLHIFGHGPDENRLRQRVRHRHLQRSVLLRGYTSDARREMCDADLFVIPSIYEGWGLTLTEAMSVGLPSVGFADCSGVNWLIKDGHNGLLAEHSAAHLAAAIDLLISDGGLRKRLGGQGKDFVEQFAPHKVYPMWAEVIRTLAGQK